MDDMDIGFSKEVSIGGLHIQTKIPPIVCNLYSEKYVIEGREYKYKTHTLWFMILGAILPLIFKGCPFDWKTGLGIGFGVGMAFNVLSFVIFKIRMKRILKGCSYQD